MTHRLDGDDVAQGTLLLKPISESEHRVEMAGLPVGQIVTMRRSFGRKVWFWSLSGPHLPLTMQTAGTNAMSLEGAKSAIKSAFDVWFERSTGQRPDIRWTK